MTRQGFGKGMHHIEDCWREDTIDMVKETRAIQQHMEECGGYEGQGGCSRCGVPRMMCQRWQARTGGGWEEVVGRGCQYDGRLAVAVITMMMDGSPEGRAVADAWMGRAGVMPTKQGEVFEWFREAAWWPDMGMEVARMVRVFYMLTEKNKRVGKVKAMYTQ